MDTTVISIATLPHLSLKGMQKHNRNNRVVENTLINWRYIRKMYKFDNDYIFERDSV